MRHFFNGIEWREELHRIQWNLKIIQENHKIGLVVRSIAVMMILLILFVTGVNARQTQAQAIQQGIAKEIVRFHCIANSDSNQDQSVKLKVKEAVVNYLRDKMAGVKSKEEAKQVIRDNETQINQIATKVLRENGFDYGVSVSLEKTEFPIKVYGDITLPAGTYEALCVRLGKAEGKNWWCIVFPALCFVDCTYGYVPEDSKEQLKYVLTDEEYDAISREKPVNIVVKFKLLEEVKSFIG